jgi:hypothetical protein
LCIIQKLVLEKEKTEDPIGETNYNNFECFRDLLLTIIKKTIITT